MKTIRFLLPVAALFISAIAFGQKNTHRQDRQTTKPYHSTEKRDRARVNGVLNANEHANENAQRNANENSVLNGTTTTATTKTKYKKKSKLTDADKRKYGTRKKA